MFKIDGLPIQIERFPDGTPRLNVMASSHDVTLEWFYEKDEEMILFFIACHLRERCQVQKLTLYMPYIPHARMDRVKNKQEVFTLKYFCDFINSLRFDEIVVRDAHSNVALALLNNVTQEQLNIKELLPQLLDPKKDIVFYPDEGSCKRYSENVKFPSAFGIKKRDWELGKIQGLEIHGTLPEPPFDALIIDDISSFGGTFLYSAQKLKEFGANKIYLYITHCENSILKGQLINSNLIEQIYTTQSIFTEKHQLIKILGGQEND